MSFSFVALTLYFQSRLNQLGTVIELASKGRKGISLEELRKQQGYKPPEDPPPKKKTATVKKSNFVSTTKNSVPATAPYNFVSLPKRVLPAPIDDL